MNFSDVFQYNGAVAYMTLKAVLMTCPMAQ